MRQKHSKELLIWSNDICDYEEQDFIDSIREYHEDPEYNPTEIELSEEFNDYLDAKYEALEYDLDIELPNCILQIADLGLWYGRKKCYGIRGCRLKEVLNAFKYDYCKLYCDQYNLKGRDIHHDGTNHYTFRVLRKDIDPDKFMDRLKYGGGYSESTMKKYTRSLKPYVLKELNYL